MAPPSTKLWDEAFLILVASIGTLCLPVLITLLRTVVKHVCWCCLPFFFFTPLFVVKWWFYEGAGSLHTEHHCVRTYCISNTMKTLPIDMFQILSLCSLDKICKPLSLPLCACVCLPECIINLYKYVFICPCKCKSVLVCVCIHACRCVYVWVCKGITHWFPLV